MVFHRPFVGVESIIILCVTSKPTSKLPCVRLYRDGAWVEGVAPSPSLSLTFPPHFTLCSRFAPRFETKSLRTANTKMREELEKFEAYVEDST